MIPVALPELLTMQDLAGLLRLASASGARRLAIRLLPTCKVGRRLYVRRAALLAYLERNETPPPPQVPELPPASPEILAALRRPSRGTEGRAR